ncbi:MAG: hypothetical protein MUF45_13545 [Spirosomaceae bacterium]|jgi:hypothetical protein|nr:hypothetical protein [Spirosomataceae bacterium]
METLIIEIQNPKVRHLIDDLVDLGLIKLKKVSPTWNERWNELSETLPRNSPISEDEILYEISEVRNQKSAQ